MKQAIMLLMTVSCLLAGCASPVGNRQTGINTILPEADAVNAGNANPSITGSYTIVDSSQAMCFDNSGEMSCTGNAFNGQDAQYAGNAPRYQDNGDGTVSDLVSGLMWQQDPGAKMTYEQAAAGAGTFDLAGYSDWRLPSIKELYSLILFDGTDASGCQPGVTCLVTPFIDTRYFTFSYGDPAAGERTIDAQFASSTLYVSTTMNGAKTMFGVNFADGRIKGYPVGNMPGNNTEKTFFVLYVRGNPDYGVNDLQNNDDGTISDLATGLTWMQADSSSGMDWQSALGYCEAHELAGYDDWRLPNAKELQSIVDYSRSPDTTSSAALDLLFSATAITNEAGQVDYPYYWSSTTHLDSAGQGSYAAYVAFGRAMGYMNAWIDVHGAGAQRSDPKTGSAAAYPQGHGPQGDAVRINNFVRCVRGGARYQSSGSPGENRPTQSIESSGIDQSQGGKNSQANPLPPQEAVQACSGSVSGSTCSFTTLNGVITGTCQSIQQQLACKPLSGP